LLIFVKQNMKKTLTTIALSLSVMLSVAQQDAQFSMNTFNRLAINPAYAGMNKALCATLLYRQQWAGFPGAPKTALLSLDYGQIAHGGVGLTVCQDQLGAEKTLAAKLAYSFHLPLAGGLLGVGLDAGMIQKSINANFVAPDGTTTATGGGVDQAIPWTGAKSAKYDLGFGLYYQTRRLYIGLSSLHLPEQKFTKSGTTNTFAWDYKYKEARHYYVMAGYTFIPDPSWEITPSILLKTVASSSQLDANLMVKWNKMIFAGVSYRLQDAIVGIIGLEKPFSKKITAKFGYSYDMTTSAIKKQSNGTHEIMLGFCYKIKPDASKTSHMNVRFL
jgi:type IX secretion system PorP/SprF family membrane protein